MEMKDILKIANEIYNKRNEVDVTDLYKAAGITPAEAEGFIQQMEAEGLAEVVEIDMCCAADYVIKGFTKKGKELIES